MNILFVCNQGRHRSRTAAELFSSEHDTRYAGVFANVKESDMSWADLILVMEEAQKTELAKLFPKTYLSKRILSLNIPDIYSYGQTELVARLKESSQVIMTQTSQGYTPSRTHSQKRRLNGQTRSYLWKTIRKNGSSKTSRNIT